MICRFSEKISISYKDFFEKNHILHVFVVEFYVFFSIPDKKTVKFLANSEVLRYNV